MSAFDDVISFTRCDHGVPLDHWCGACDVPVERSRPDTAMTSLCRHGVALHDYCGTCEADWLRSEMDGAWTPEDRKALDAGAWLGLAILLLVAVVAFGAGYWMGGMR